jgi:predicted membrane protein
MEIKPAENQSRSESPFFERDPHFGRILAGLIVIAVGAILLARQAGVFLPDWIFSWGTILLGVGLFIGARRSFQGFTWLVLMLVGTVVLFDDFVADISLRQYLWPVVIITIGVLMILRPKRLRRGGRFFGERTSRWQSQPPFSDDAVDSVSVFGGTKKIVISKNFKGGDLTTFFGGNELNLMQADFQGVITIDITQMFGGTKLVVPANWNIKSDVVCIFASVEDKRQPVKEAVDESKILRLDGTCIFGGIEIKTY